MPPRTTDEITPEQITKKQAGAAKVAAEYFDAINRHDIEAAVAMWHPGGRENVRGQVDTTAPDGVREFLSMVIGAMPDMRFEIVETTVQQERAAVRWRLHGTFTGTPYMGIEATGTPLELEGVDILIVRDGKIAENNAFSDGMTFAAQLGLLPPTHSKAQQRMTRAFNAKTRMLRKMAGAPEEIADGVWLVRGGFPVKTMNVYLLRDGDGVLAFDGGIRAMVNQVAAAGASLGGITRLVLSHAHPDHRGIASRLGVPVYCHPADKADAEGDGGTHYFDYSKLDLHGRLAMPRLLKTWDGGPVQIAGTVEEGDEVAGFKVVHLPGHSPGLIGLWREADRLALSADCFYTLDPQTGIKGKPRVPHRAFNDDTEQARASIRKLAAMEPAVAWPGHADPLRGDVRSQLEEAAATT
jgi:glyoxylase-like metal-dependent hydrolase (beta-lactamase superfamily II)/predicted ester cyclase